jgi:hypothetical protein
MHVLRELDYEPTSEWTQLASGRSFKTEFTINRRDRGIICDADSPDRTIGAWLQRLIQSS